MIVFPVFLIHHREVGECRFGKKWVEAGVDASSKSPVLLERRIGVCEEGVAREYEAVGWGKDCLPGGTY